MKVIFLDIDGVLITLRSFEQFKIPTKFAQADPACVIQLNRILIETQARIVLSSTWRIGLKSERLPEMNRQFIEWGVCSEIMDFTPVLEGHSGDVVLSVTRGREIETWLNNHPVVKEFAIIDDDDDMDHLKSKLVQTDFRFGLTGINADQVIRMLGGGAR